MCEFGDREKEYVDSHGIYDGKKGFKIIAFDATQRYDGVERFVITDTEPGKLGGEVDRVAREKVTMNTIKCTIDLPYRQRVTGTHNAATRTKNVIFPSLKKYVSCRGNESLVVIGLASADTPVRLVDMASSTVGWTSGASRAI